MIKSANKKKSELQIPDEWKSELEISEIDREKLFANVRLNTIIKKISDGIVIVSKDGLILLTNPVAESILGQKQEDLIHKPFGFPILDGEFTEIELINKNGTVIMAEMRTTEIEWNMDR